MTGGLIPFPPPLSGFIRSGHARQREADRRPLPDAIRLHPYLPAVSLDDPLHGGKPDAGTGNVRVEVLIEPEDVRQVLFFDARAVIPHKKNWSCDISSDADYHAGFL